MARGSLPWVIIAAALSIGVAVFLEAALIHPFFSHFFDLNGWRGSDLAYANAGMRMVGAFAKNLLLVIVFGISFGVLLEAREAI